MKRRLGDRKDGWRLRKIDPFFRMIPYIMRERNDAQVFFEERIYLEETLKMIRELRREGYKAGFLHVVIASMVRVMSQKPKVNRFVRGRKIYARNEISFSLAVKKEMNEHAEETTVKIIFEPTDTIYDVINKINAVVDANKVVEDKNNTDKFVKIFSKVPGFVVGGMIGLIKFLDNRGILPKVIYDLSPFHSSIFVTNLGSLGIRPVYHHLYNIGTNTVFIAFGTRTKEQVISDDMNLEHRKAMDIKIVVDERVVDGYYFASAIKLATKIMENPYVLKEKPEQVILDDEI
jgi:hypothetical protein